MDLKRFSESRIEPVVLKKVTVPISPFESRGSRMLAAALNNKTPLKERSSIVSSDEQHQQHVEQIRAAQQVELKNRKRSPKNNVLFREPVVSQEYEYEPTYLDEQQEQQINKLSERQSEPGREQTQVTLVEPLKQDREISNFSINDKTKKGFGLPASEQDDDDDDALYTLAQSDEIKAQQEKAIDRAKGAVKRTHESIEDFEDKEHADNKQTCKSESGGGGLFSSPKVAKIAPYFDERPHERQAAEARAMQQNRLKIQQQNYQRSRSLSTSKYSINRRQINDKSHARVTELISYKKVSSPKIFERHVMMTRPSTSEPIESQPNQKCTPEPSSGYLGWISSFINQMNKLIF